MPLSILVPGTGTISKRPLLGAFLIPPALAVVI